MPRAFAFQGRSRWNAGPPGIPPRSTQTLRVPRREAWFVMLAGFFELQANSMELNPIQAKIADLGERLSALRGFL